MIIYTLLIAGDCSIESFHQAASLAGLHASAMGEGDPNLAKALAGLPPVVGAGDYEIGRSGERRILLFVRSIEVEGLPTQDSGT